MLNIMRITLFPPDIQPRCMLWVSRHLFVLDHWLRKQTRRKLVQRSVHKKLGGSIKYATARNDARMRWIFFLGPEAAQYALLESPHPLSRKLQHHISDHLAGGNWFLAARPDLAPELLQEILETQPISEAMRAALRTNPAISDEVKTYLALTYPEVTE